MTSVQPRPSIFDVRQRMAVGRLLGRRLVVEQGAERSGRYIASSGPIRTGDREVVRRELRVELTNSLAVLIFGDPVVGRRGVEHREVKALVALATLIGRGCREFDL